VRVAGVNWGFKGGVQLWVTEGLKAVIVFLF
jgi:hypothetical protein